MLHMCPPKICMLKVQHPGIVFWRWDARREGRKVEPHCGISALVLKNHDSSLFSALSFLSSLTDTIQLSLNIHGGLSKHRNSDAQSHIKMTNYLLL